MNIISGRWLYGRWVFAGNIKSSKRTEETTPLIPNVFSVKCYNADGRKTAEYSSTAAENPVISIKFELIETGCGSFEIVFGKLPDKTELSYNQRIDIHFFNDSKPWYSGIVTERPAPGSTEKTFKFKGFGYYTLLERVLITGIFKNMDVADIVREVANDISAKTGIIVLSSEIERVGYAVTEIRFDSVTAKKVLSQLTEFTPNYVSGVDEFRRLYFKQISADINEQARFWSGRHIKEFEPVEDVEDLVNYVKIKGGKLDDNGTNWLAEVEDLPSQNIYGRREAVWTLPTAFAEEDALRWGYSELAKYKDPKISAKIKGIDLNYPNADGSFNVRKLTPKGKAAIASVDGNVHQYPITKVIYTVNASGAVSCDVQLGEPPFAWDTYIVGLEREAKNQELLQSYNIEQVSGG